MTEVEEKQLRAILEIEGFAATEIEQMMADHKRKAKPWAEHFLRNWKLIPETIEGMIH